MPGVAQRKAESPPRRSRRAFVAWAAWLASTLGLEAAAPAHAQAVAGDAAARARIVVTFTRFVEWPAGVPAADAALRLCVLQASPAVAAAFAPHAGANVNGRRLDIRFDAGASLASCHAVYVDASAARAAPVALAAAAEAGPMLTLGAAEGFLALGGMVEILIVDDALRFDVNLVALRAAQLNIDPGVLKLARRVRRAP